MNKELKKRITAAVAFSITTRYAINSLRAQKSHCRRWVHEYETSLRWQTVFALRHAKGTKEHGDAIDAMLSASNSVARYTKEIASLDARILSEVEYAESLMAKENAQAPDSFVTSTDPEVIAAEAEFYAQPAAPTHEHVLLPNGVADCCACCDDLRAGKDCDCYTVQDAMEAYEAEGGR